MIKDSKYHGEKQSGKTSTTALVTPSLVPVTEFLLPSAKADETLFFIENVTNHIDVNPNTQRSQQHRLRDDSTVLWTQSEFLFELLYFLLTEIVNVFTYSWQNEKGKMHAMYNSLYPLLEHLVDTTTGEIKVGKISVGEV